MSFGADRNRCLYLADPELADAVGIYCDAKAAQRVSANTMRIARRVLGDFCSWASDAGLERVSEISVLAVQAFMRELSADHSPATVHIYYRNLRTFSYYFEDLTDGAIRSPFHSKALHAPKIPEEKHPAADADAVFAFCKACSGRFALRNRAFFLTAFDSGLRLAEVCALRICDIDLISGRIEVLHGKGSKFRVCFVSTVTLKAVRRYLAERAVATDAEPLFVSATGGHLTAQGMQAIRYKIERESGIRLGGFHALRRGFAKAFLKNGGDLFSLQNLLGHAEVGTTRGYVQLDPDELAEIYSRSSPLDRIHRRK